MRHPKGRGIRGVEGSVGSRDPQGRGIHGAEGSGLASPPAPVPAAAQLARPPGSVAADVPTWDTPILHALSFSCFCSLNSTQQPSSCADVSCHVPYVPRQGHPSLLPARGRLLVTCDFAEPFRSQTTCSRQTSLWCRRAGNCCALWMC